MSISRAINTRSPKILGRQIDLLLVAEEDANDSTVATLINAALASDALPSPPSA